MKPEQRPSPRLEAMIERSLGDLERGFNPLHPECMLDYHVAGVRNGYVLLTFAVPEGMTKAFVSTLDGLHGLFRFVDLKSRVASIESRNKSHDLDEIQRRENIKNEFQEKVCSHFDRFTAQGYDRNEAIRRTNSALKAEKEPWANYATVTDTLRAAGRFRKGVKKQKS